MKRFVDVYEIPSETLCEECGARDAQKCVEEKTIETSRGFSIDAPVVVGTFCEMCRIEFEYDLLSDWEDET